VTETRPLDLHAYLASEHARLHIIAPWPESAWKQALLAAVRSSIQRLMDDPAAGSFQCIVCRAVAPRTVTPLPARREPVRSVQGRAA